MKKLSKSMLTGLVLGSIMMTGTAFAAEEMEAFDLDQIVVTAQRTETKDLDTPASVTVITAEDIQKSGAKTVYEMIERQVGLTNNAYGPGGREFGGSCSRLVLRGLDKGTLVMVNGAPINTMNYNNPGVVPVNAVEKIEIVRGAQSVLYGSEATGGVINIITKKGGKPVTTISGGAGNFDKKWSVTSVGEKYNVAIQKDFYGSVGQTNRIFEKSTRLWKYRKSTNENAFVSISPSEALTLNYMHSEGNYYRDDISVSKGLIKGLNIAYLYKDTRDNASLIYNDKENQIKGTISFTQREVDPYQFAGDKKTMKYGPMKRGSSSDWIIHTLTADVQKAWDLRDNKDKLIVGLMTGNEESKDRSKNDAGERSNFAAYASYNMNISDKFSTTVGVRAVHIKDDYSKKYDYAGSMSKVLPQLQMLYKVNDTNSFYMNAGKSFQMPPLNQYFSRKEKETKVGELKPQEGWTYEAGWKHITDSSSLKADVFYMDVDAKFDWTPKDADGNQYLINSGTFKNTGVEVEYKKSIGSKFGYNLSAYLANPKTKEKKTYKQSEAKLQLGAGIDYTLGKLTSNLNYLYVGKREQGYYNSNGDKASDAGADHVVPYRSLLNANFTYKADEHHALNLQFNNMLGRHDTINKYENWSMPYNWMLNYSFSF